jgi:hypothetical protein
VKVKEQSMATVVGEREVENEADKKADDGGGWQEKKFITLLIILRGFKLSHTHTGTCEAVLNTQGIKEASDGRK